MLKAWRRVRSYVKHDLMEIIAPSSLEYPPGEEELNRKQGLTWKALRLATEEYMDTWRSPKPAEHASAEGGKPAVAEPPLMQELAGLARSGAQGAKPLLQELYRTRASAYTGAVRQFVEGYKEGYAGLPEEEDPLASGASSKPAGVGAAGIPTAGAAAPAGASMESAEQHLGNNAESSQGAAKPATRTGVEGAVKSTVAASTEQAGSTRQ